jgi:hypothetical protein
MHVAKRIACTLVATAAACGGAPDARFPPRPDGCDVMVMGPAPGFPTENIGPVRAWCDLALSDTECVRALQDQVCKLGGDVVWGVDEKPTEKEGRKHMSGRAAKRK